jgi:hypothetical protein
MSEASTFTFPVHNGEVEFLLWLVIMGAKEQIVTSPPYAWPTDAKILSANFGINRANFV